jgi:hypothetical protein
MLKEGGTTRERGQIGRWDREGDRQGEGTGGERQKGGQIGRGERQAINREGYREGVQTGRGYRQEGGTDTLGVGALVAVCGAIFVCGCSLFIDGRLLSPGADIIVHWWHAIACLRLKVVEVGTRSTLWLEGGGGVAVWYRVVVVVSGCCCLWAAVPVCRHWVVICWCWVAIVCRWGMVILGGDDRSWVADGGGSGVMVVLGGGGVVVSVLKSSPVWFFYLETKQLTIATSLYLSRY